MTILRVLIVEDEPLIAMLLAEVITEMGHDICAMESTEATAVAAALRTKPDLMIVDAGLGEGSGVKAVEEILLNGFVPHIFVSGDDLSDVTLSPDAVVLQKPFREKDLVRAIERVAMPSKQLIGE
ncbi:response regulator (plasmid) [Phyllobacterium sp. 628]|uniref:response regulator n=1 Tax=Phyllobacterium sp. 628 TaxID=2718938 RepID=UPI001662584E|nr:response regulator [Phyllobacterium sp. 628]QND54489.1 response regulator [Phyllobacterium sp. 628]